MPAPHPTCASQPRTIRVTPHNVNANAPAASTGGHTTLKTSRRVTISLRPWMVRDKAATNAETTACAPATATIPYGARMSTAGIHNATWNNPSLDSSVGVVG